MKGTTYSANRAIERRPPKMTSPAKKAVTRPTQSLGTPKALSTASAMELACTALNTSPNESISASAKITPAQGGFQPLGNVERGSPAVLPLVILYLVQLGEGAFRVGRGHTDRCHYPHPEDGTGAAQIQGHGNPGNIARTDARSETGTQRLEGGYPVAVAGSGTDDGAEHLAKMTELD